MGNSASKQASPEPPNLETGRTEILMLATGVLALTLQLTLFVWFAARKGWTASDARQGEHQSQTIVARPEDHSQLPTTLRKLTDDGTTPVDEIRRRSSSLSATATRARTDSTRRMTLPGMGVISNGDELGTNDGPDSFSHEQTKSKLGEESKTECDGTVASKSQDVRELPSSFEVPLNQKLQETLQRARRALDADGNMDTESWRFEEMMLDV